MTACGGAAEVGPARPERTADVPAAVRAFVELQHGDDEGYRIPGRAAREDLAAATGALGGGDRDEAARLAGRHGYAPVDGPDGSVLLRPRRLPDARGWGLIVVRPAGAPLLVEVPHPRSDQDTDDLGARLAAAASARYLIVAGARRGLDGGAADPSHREDALLHAVHVALVRRGIPAVQVHGYADENLPSADVVVSPGDADTGPLHRAVADAVEGMGLRTCRTERERCPGLEGRTNVQSRASAQAGVPFVHLEVSRRVRAEPASREGLARAVARAARLLG